MHNNLFVNRLVIRTDSGPLAYDEKFHKGINIVRGQNSSGKSTITHFLFYALGGEFTDFVPEARQCSSVVVEVEVNSVVVTLKRELLVGDDNKIVQYRPMFIFWGSYTESIKENQRWEKYGYKSTENRTSFSNVLFNLLDIPIVKGDNNITMHQILRLMYVDQDSPTSSLFYYEYFDSQITRETVSDLLLGVYNENLYVQKRRLIEAKKELEGIRAEIRSTKRFFPNKLTLDPKHINTLIENKVKNIAAIEDSIIKQRKDEVEIKLSRKDKFEFEQLKEKVIKQRLNTTKLEEQIALLADEILDSEFFISTLRAKIKALKDSIATRDYLGSLPIQFCPECLTQINDSLDESKCKLCKESIDDNVGIIQAKKMQQEILFQINESKKLLKFRNNKIVELKANLKTEKSILFHMQNQVESALTNVRSVKDEKLDKLLEEKGFIEGELLQYRTLLENAELFSKLEDERDKLVTEVNTLKSNIEDEEFRQEKLKKDINNKIRQEGVYLLNNDLERQDDFKMAKDFFIDFPNNLAYLSNKYSKYSASSNFYLKVAARFSIFLASLSVEGMRYPRFIFADNMEDKGIEEIRAQNLQKILIDRLRSFDSNEFQVIYTTSYITKELNNSDMVVGDFYTKENRTLKNVN